MAFRVLLGSLLILAVSGCMAGGGIGAPGGEGTLAGREFLAPDQHEDEGFGAYSYVLIRKVDERSTALLDAYMKLPEAARLVMIFAPDKLNATYVPVTAAPQPPSADELAKVYDLARALLILQTQHLDGEGPFIVTASVKLASVHFAAHHLSVMDLSSAPASSMSLWMQLFVDESTHPEKWISNGAAALALRFQDRLVQGGDAAKATLGGLEDGTKVLKVLGGG